MKKFHSGWISVAVVLVFASITGGPREARASDDRKEGAIRHVLLISVDGMHALDLKIVLTA
jgi:hypothetical protein